MLLAITFVASIYKMASIMRPFKKTEAKGDRTIKSRLNFLTLGPESSTK